MPTYVTKERKTLHPKETYWQAETAYRKRRKEARDRCLKESHGEFGKSESTLQLIRDQSIHFEADSSKDLQETGN